MNHNINDLIRFKPTPHGLVIFRNSYTNYGVNINLEGYLDVEGYMQMSIWEFASIFGPQMYMGNPHQCIENNTFTFVS